MCRSFGRYRIAGNLPGIKILNLMICNYDEIIFTLRRNRSEFSAWRTLARRN